MRLLLLLLLRRQTVIQLMLLSLGLWLLQPMQGINGLLRQLLWWLQMEVARPGSLQLSKTACANVSLQLMSVYLLLMVMEMLVQRLLLLEQPMMLVSWHNGTGS